MADDVILRVPEREAEVSPEVRSATTRALRGAVNAAVVLAVSWPLWFLLLHPNGILKLYTPMYGFALVAVLVGVLVAMTRVAEGWPLHASPLPRPVRGLVL